MYRQMLTGVWVNLSKHRDFGHSVAADRHHETQNTACASLISVWERKKAQNEFILMPYPSIGAKWPIDHFGTKHFGKSHFGTDVSSREHFGTCTVRRCGRSGRWTFQHWNVSTWGIFITGNFQH